MDFSLTTLVVACFVLLAMLAWAYFDFPGTDAI